MEKRIDLMTRAEVLDQFIDQLILPLCDSLRPSSVLLVSVPRR